VIERPALVDPKVAAKTFAAHMNELWASGRPDKLGWRRISIDPLHEVVLLPARREDGTVEDYYVQLGAEFYDRWPPTVAFVVPETWEEAPGNSRWFPMIEGVGWFALHTGVAFPQEYAVNGEAARQLVCFTGSAQYYMVDHAPPESAIWRQGERTVSMTLSRLHEVLNPPFYKHPAGEE
jgi:hypothetical protein